MKGNNGPVIGFFRKLTIVLGGLMLVFTAGSAIAGFAWRIATEPLVSRMESIADSSAAADRAVLREIARITAVGQFNRSMILALAEANEYPVGDPRRNAKVREVRRLHEQSARAIEP